jgi:hypothetical protein
MLKTMPSRALRLITLGTALAASVFLLSCEKLRFAADKHYPVSQPATHVLPRYGPYAGSLPNTVEAMGAVAFRDFVRARSWYGWARTRTCKGFLCALHLQTTEVSAEAIEDADAVDITALGTSRFPVVVARLKNHGSHADARYGIPATDEEWYFVWHNDPAGKPVARIAVLRDPNGTPTLTFVGDDKPVKACVHRHPVPKSSKAEADLTGCSDYRVGYEPSLRQSSRAVSVTMLVSSYRTADAWISCSQGCCTSDAP